MPVQYPYRAVILGKEYIVKGWRGKKLLTNKGSFIVRHIYRDWELENHRLFEVATIGGDGNGGWLVNGKPLSSIEAIPYSERWGDIKGDENLRVFKDQIHAVAWIDKVGNTTGVTEALDLALKFWETANLPVAQKQDEDTLTDVVRAWNISIRSQRIFAPSWSGPIWLGKFRSVEQAIQLSPEQKKLAAITAELEEKTAKLQKAEEVAADTLKEALEKWMKFNPPSMSADTQARIEKAVRLYMTDSQKRSLSKIAAEFKVTPKTVSLWFKAFTKETGFRVVSHKQHVSVKEHLETEAGVNEGRMTPRRFGAE
jgi:Skp family chaperone for outer membrane proteins